MIIPVLLDYWYEGVEVAVEVDTAKLYDRVAEKLHDAVVSKRTLPVIMTRKDMQSLHLAATRVLDKETLPAGTLTISQG